MDPDLESMELVKTGLAEPTKVLLESNRLLPLLTQFKVLSRKQSNRKAVGEQCISSLLRHLNNTACTPRIKAEGANVVLNICYEKENVDTVLRCGAAATLVGCLGSLDEELQANAAGALQSICFQPEGRRMVRELGAIPALVDLLSSPSLNVKARAVGALHNMSSDVDSIRIIRKKGGIKHLIRLLQTNQACISGSVAGALQNVSREVASRLIIRDSNAIPSLVNLLNSSEIQTQVCAAGALLNVLGPEMADDSSNTKLGQSKRQAFVQYLKSRFGYKPETDAEDDTPLFEKHHAAVQLTSCFW